MDRRRLLKPETCPQKKSALRFYYSIVRRPNFQRILLHLDASKTNRRIRRSRKLAFCTGGNPKPIARRQQNRFSINNDFSFFVLEQKHKLYLRNNFIISERNLKGIILFILLLLIRNTTSYSRIFNIF